MRETPAPIDTSPYEQEVSDALEAFSSDPSYAVAVAHAANATVSKRRLWKLRAELEEAEAAARSLCADAEFYCKCTSPCGTGTCHFSSGKFADINIDSRGTTFRPQLRNAGSYSLEDAITELKRRR